MNDVRLQDLSFETGPRSEHSRYKLIFLIRKCWPMTIDDPENSRQPLDGTVFMFSEASEVNFNDFKHSEYFFVLIEFWAIFILGKLKTCLYIHLLKILFPQKSVLLQTGRCVLIRHL